MKKVLDYLQSNFTGVRRIKVTSKLYARFPKVARLFWIGFLTMFIGDLEKVQAVTPVVTYIGYAVTSLAIFCFLMLRILKKRQFNGLTQGG